MSKVISYKGQKYVRVDSDADSIVSNLKQAFDKYKKQQEDHIEKHKKKHEEFVKAINSAIEKNEAAVKKTEQMLKSGKTKGVYNVVAGNGDTDWLIASDHVRNKEIKPLDK